MDSLTHIAIGACIGEAFFEKGFGKKAMLWGALAQSIPDIDFLTAYWQDTPGSLLSHRGFTHSLLFVFLITPVFSLAADHIHRSHRISMRKWLLFFFTELMVHLFLDGFNNYGTGWLEPFSHQRFSWNTVYVADPFFSIPAGIALGMLLVLKKHSLKRRTWARLGLLVPLVYLGYCSINKIIINHEVNEILQQENIPHQRYFTTPAPLQNWLWYVVAGNDTGYRVGYISVFDHEKKINFQFFPRRDSLLRNFMNSEALLKLKRFSQQYYTVEKWNDTLVFNDLRFGQILGWQNPRGHFVFHYFLEQPENNKVVVQRGRFAGWNWKAMKQFLRRIRGI